MQVTTLLTNKTQNCLKMAHPATYKISNETAKVMQIAPTLILGSANLLTYDAVHRKIRLSSSFYRLLKLLVTTKQLDAHALKTKNFQDLNTIFQKFQGPKGGLLREAGVERWHLQDSNIHQQYRSEFNSIFQKMGLMNMRTQTSIKKVEHCVLFGADVWSMEIRINETLATDVTITDQICLLSCNRKLEMDEVKYLMHKIENTKKITKSHWKKIFKQQEQLTEANAFLCLWELLASEDLQNCLGDKVCVINSTKIGNCYKEKEGYRTTTVVTIEDWMAACKDKEPASLFAFIEQPFSRLNDQLYFNIISKKKKAPLDELINRIKERSFYLLSYSSTTAPVPIYLDEIARNFYHTTEVLSYFESQSPFIKDKDKTELIKISA